MPAAAEKDKATQPKATQWLRMKMALEAARHKLSSAMAAVDAIEAQLDDVVPEEEPPKPAGPIDWNAEIDSW